MALLSMAHEYAPKSRDSRMFYKTEKFWVNCQQKELDELSEAAVCSYIVNGKVSPAYVEQISILDHERAFMLGSAALGLCIAGVTHNFIDNQGDSIDVLGSVFSGLGGFAMPLLATGTNMFLADHDIYGPLTHFRAHQQTKQLKELIGDGHQLVTETTYELRCLIKAQNKTLSQQYRLDPDDMTTLASVLDHVVPDKSDVIEAFEENSRAPDNERVIGPAAKSLCSEITRTMEPALAGAYAKHRYLVDTAKHDKKRAAIAQAEADAAYLEAKEERFNQILGYNARLLGELESDK